MVIFKLNEQNQQLTKKQIFKKERDDVMALFTDMKLVDSTGDNVRQYENITCWSI